MLGSLTFFTGPMACGKTLELVRHLQLYAAQRVPTVCIRPTTDTRSEKIQSRSGLSYSGLTIDEKNLDGIKSIIEQYRVIGVDEFQFFPPEAAALLHAAIMQNKIILVSGLDTDFRGDIFPAALALLSIPETVVKRSRAVCSVCREHNATRTQRLKDGQPVSRHEPTVAVEISNSDITYEPRCLEHHAVTD
ncbi:hypothetical protein KKF59_02000 [Patescibacteria group bacterium]|nr:hypothetical protein [Patescibacteria group bacterium]MBU1034849.1 hypothetical protein [Patescibacteria group bacterium]MBU1629605.1 hypothetical protein [Patescibacteria group bacterium]MBU1907883.1 hypothetical protein [Patescibacteria group bacterium]